MQLGLIQRPNLLMGLTTCYVQALLPRQLEQRQVRQLLQRRGSLEQGYPRTMLGSQFSELFGIAYRYCEHHPHV